MLKDFLKGCLGMGATNGPVILAQAAAEPATSFAATHSRLIFELQVVSLFVGIVVGLLTSVSVGLTVYWKLTNKKKGKSNNE